MNYFCDINIGDIKIIIKKTEKNNFVFRNHSRARSGFVCFLTGEGSLEIDGVGTYHIEPGSFFRYEAGDRYFINVPTPCEYYVSEIDIDVNETNVFPRNVLCTKDEISLLENIHRIWNEQNEYCYMETRILLLRFFMNVSKRIRTIMSSPRFISDALSFIHRHYNENFSIADIASACNVSPSYLRNQFRQEHHIPIMQYREEFRISRAKTMLESGEHTIKEISDFLGYCDVYHFSHKFKLATGLSPKQYLQANIQNRI